MSSSFDPYYTWLGIPAAEQPPHHYRLLGLSPFETDLTAIAHASDRQLSFLKLHTKGEQGVQAERLIREVKAAERCLLDPQQKTAYDGDLQTAQAALSAEPEADAPNAALPPVVTQEIPFQPPFEPSEEFATNSPFDPLDGKDSAPESATPLQKQPRSRPPEPTAAGRLIAILLPTVVMGGILFFVGKKFMGSSSAPPHPVGRKSDTDVIAQKEKGKPDSQQAHNHSASHTGTANGEKRPSGEENTKPVKTGIVVPKPTGSWNNRIDSDASPSETPTVSEKPPVDQTSSEKRAEKPPTEKASAEQSPVQSVDKRLPVPDGPAQDDARKLVLDIFSKEISSAKSTSEKGALAAKFLQQAQESKSDPPGCYVLILAAREAALDSGDLDLVLRTADLLGDVFRVSAAQEKLAMLTAYSDRASKLSGQKAVAEAALQTSREWGAAEDYENALAAARLAYSIVTDKKLDDPKLAKAILSFGKDLVAAQARREAYQTSVEKLKTQPDDPEANLAVGRWFWYVQQDIPQGAAYLVKSGDADLKPLAEKEIATTKDAAATVALADEWWDVAQKTEVAAERSIQLRRADYWYRQASASLTGLLKAKADKRLEDLAPILAAEDAAKSAEKTAARTTTLNKVIRLTTEEVRMSLNGGSFEVLSRDSKSEELDIWEFTGGGDVVKTSIAVAGGVKRINGSETIARWEPGESRALLRFTKSPLIGTLQFANKSEGTGVVKSTQGALAFGFQFKKIVPVANVVLHTPREVNYTFLSNGAIGSPANFARTWSLQGKELTIHERGNDTVYTLSDDKKTLRSHSLNGGPDIRGEVTFLGSSKD